MNSYRTFCTQTVLLRCEFVSAMAKYLQVPLVYARKRRSLVMANTFDAGHNSKTIGQDQQLLVSRDHLDEDDHVLIVDDFLLSG